jgi:hypothetical protein
MESRQRWIVVVAVLASLVLAAAAAALGQTASVYFDPPSGRLAGGQRDTLTVMYDGTDVTVGLRSYHLTIDFDDTYVFVDSLDVCVVEGGFLQGAGATTFSASLSDPNTLLVDCAITDATGASGTGDLCSIAFTGQPTGDGVSPVIFVAVDLLDPDDLPIAHATTDGSVELDNTPPNIPTLDPEPEYTYGSSNYVSWSDESASGAVGYCSECSEFPDFRPIYMSSGCTPELGFLFEPLAYDQIYYYRVQCRDDLWNTSDWSEAVFSTQLEPATGAERTTWGVIKSLFR